jgi:putative MFS transporter
MGRISIDEALDRAGTGAFQRRLLGIFGLVWTADAMQVLAVGFTAASIAATFGLTVPQALQTGTLFFLGMLIGAYGFGRLADKVGRRNVLILTVACDALFGVLSIFAPSFAILLVFRFLTGIAVGGTLPVDYAMMAEFLPAKSRGRWLVALEGFWAIGTLIVALAAWAASVAGVQDAWRYIFAVTAIPALLGLGLRFFVPESPLYLLRSGRLEEAKTTVNRVLTTNGKPALGFEEELVSAPQGVSEGLFSGGLRRRSLLILAIWFLVSVSYYGVFTWMPAKLAGDGFGFVRGYGFLVFVALAQVPGYVLAAYGVEAWGRKPTLVGFCLLSALGCLLFVVSTSDVMVGASLLIMSFALLGTWGALYAYTPELYPTSVRATGMGTAGAMARLVRRPSPELSG